MKNFIKKLFGKIEKPFYCSHCAVKVGHLSLENLEYLKREQLKPGQPVAVISEAEWRASEKGKAAVEAAGGGGHGGGAVIIEYAKPIVNDGEPNRAPISEKLSSGDHVRAEPFAYGNGGPALVQAEFKNSLIEKTATSILTDFRNLVNERCTDPEAKGKCMEILDRLTEKYL